MSGDSTSNIHFWINNGYFHFKANYIYFDNCYKYKNICVTKELLIYRFKKFLGNITMYPFHNENLKIILKTTINEHFINCDKHTLLW